MHTPDVHRRHSLRRPIHTVWSSGLQGRPGTRVRRPPRGGQQLCGDGSGPAAGGRLADILGRRRMFLIAAVTFGLASILAGDPTNPEMLVSAGSWGVGEAARVVLRERAARAVRAHGRAGPGLSEPAQGRRRRTTLTASGPGAGRPRNRRPDPITSAELPDLGTGPAGFSCRSRVSRCGDTCGRSWPLVGAVPDQASRRSTNATVCPGRT